MATTLDNSGLVLTQSPSAPEGKTLGPPPPRRPMSLRRTASQQAHWQARPTDRYEMSCRARDYFTGPSLDRARIAGEEWITAQMHFDAVVEAFAASNREADLAALAGLRVGGPLRKAVAETMPEEPANSTLLYRMIDDMAGGAFLSGAAWQTWLAGGMNDFARAIDAPSIMDMKMEGMCISYRPGSPALLPDGRQNDRFAYRSVAPIAVDPDGDPDAWHPVLHFDTPNQSRLRYMDVWRADGKVHALFGFQDSAAFPGTELRRLFHEYRGTVVMDPESLVLEAIEMEFGSLPYTTCHAAAQTPEALIGRSLADFRQTVIDVLKGTAGCTHLNDCLRTLQDVPAMVRTLDRCLADQGSGR